MKCTFIATIMMLASAVTGQEYYFRQIPLDLDDDIQKIELLFQGTDQMIWMGTDQGLYSFDGTRYWKIERPVSGSFSVTTIAENPNGEIWAGYEDGLIHVVSVLGINRVIPTDSLQGISIKKILFQDDGEIIIATYGLGVWLLREKQLSRIMYDSLLQVQDVYDALLDNEDRLWIATDRGIWIYEQEPQEKLIHLGREHGLPDEVVTKLLAEDNGDVWIGMLDHGLARYIGGRDSIIHVELLEPEDGKVISLRKGNSNDVWVGTESAIGHYSAYEQGRRIQLPAEITDLEDILFDYTGNIWISSESKASGSGNKLFMANTHLQHQTPDVTGMQTIANLDGKLWLGCQSGLYSMDEEGGDMTQHLQKEQLNILTIYIDHSGYLWIGTFGQGLYVYDPFSGRTRHLTEADNISNNSILNIDGRGNSLWLATLGGITEISWTNNPFKDKLVITPFQAKFKFPPGYVYDVYADQNDRVWFGTDGKGLFYLEQNQLFSFNQTIVQTKDTIDMKTIYSITGDNRGNLWVSTKGHILNLDINGRLIEQLSSTHVSENSVITSGIGEIIIVREGAIQIKSPSNGVFFFSTSTGLSSFSPQLNAISRDKDGSVWIADTDHILHYIPSLSDTASYVRMHMVGISPGNLSHEETLRLRPDSNYLDLRFTGLWYPDPSRVQYRYKLENHDLDWIYTHEGRAVYSKLTPGEYTFIVEGSFNEDFSQAKPLKREIIVLTPFYSTWWFILGIFMLISFLAIQFIRSRIKHFNKLHQLEKEKTTLQLHAIQAQVNPHFLFNSFNTLSNIIEEDQKSAVAYVDQLSGFFRGVLMHRDAELITLAEEIIIMRNYSYILQKRYGENIMINEKIDTKEGYIAPLSIQLLVENAIKHNKVTSEKPLTISITIGERWVEVSNPIQPKFQPVTESTGFGLSSLLTRYQYLTAEKIEIQNDGKTFTVRIPIIRHKN